MRNEFFIDSYDFIVFWGFKKVNHKSEESQPKKSSKSNKSQSFKLVKIGQIIKNYSKVIKIQ